MIDSLDNYKKITNKFLKSLIKELGNSLLSLVLYGSVARGTSKEYSDIDLLLIIEKLPDNYHIILNRVLDVRARVETEIKEARRLSFLIFSREEARENRYIYLDMIDDAKILYDKEKFFATKLKQMKNRLKELGSKKIYLPDGTWYWDLKPDLKLGERFTL